ncbi:MAG: hypothetical protein KDC83_02605 [Flavobacteriales bacterium]|nr:hypothetical protein [Flavobacteriales bacterium]
MKHCNIFLVILLCLNMVAFGQNEEQKSKSNQFSFGMKLVNVQDDFGMGLDFTSPYFVYNSLAVRLNTLIQFHDHFDPTLKEDTWSPYFVSRLGLVGVGGRPAPFLRLYGEGGAVVGVPSSNISNEGVFMGGYGLFGFEMFMSANEGEVASYYIELGATGAGARGDLLLNNPIYYNGFSIGTGFRFYL